MLWYIKWNFYILCIFCNYISYFFLNFFQVNTHKCYKLIESARISYLEGNIWLLQYYVYCFNRSWIWFDTDCCILIIDNIESPLRITWFIKLFNRFIAYLEWLKGLWECCNRLYCSWGWLIVFIGPVHFIFFVPILSEMINNPKRSLYIFEVSFEKFEWIECIVVVRIGNSIEVWFFIFEKCIQIFYNIINTLNLWWRKYNWISLLTIENDIGDLIRKKILILQNFVIATNKSIPFIKEIWEGRFSFINGWYEIDEILGEASPQFNIFTAREIASINSIFCQLLCNKGLSDCLIDGFCSTTFTKLCEEIGSIFWTHTFFAIEIIPSNNAEIIGKSFWNSAVINTNFDGLLQLINEGSDIFCTIFVNWCEFLYFVLKIQDEFSAILRWWFFIWFYQGTESFPDSFFLYSLGFSFIDHQTWFDRIYILLEYNLFEYIGLFLDLIQIRTHHRLLWLSCATYEWFEIISWGCISNPSRLSNISHLNGEELSNTKEINSS